MTTHPARTTPSTALDILVDVAIARAHSERVAHNPSPPPPASLPARLAPLAPAHGYPPRMHQAFLPLQSVTRPYAALPPLSRVSSLPSIVGTPPTAGGALPIPIPVPGNSPRGSASARAKRGRRESYTRFSTEEEMMLLDGVSVYGAGNWKKILNAYNFHWKRTAVDLKDKYRNITRARMRRAAATGGSTSEGSSVGSTASDVEMPSRGTPVAMSPLSAPPVLAGRVQEAYLHASGHRGTGGVRGV